MADRDKVIKGLGLCQQGFDCPSDCPYLDDCNDLMKPMFVELAKDALELLKEQEPIRCIDCAYALYKEGVQPGHIVCTKPYTERWQVVKPNNWYCADGVIKDNCSEFPNSSVGS